MAIISQEPIKVKELIEYLSKYDGEKIVQIESSWGEYSPDEIHEIKETNNTIILSSALWQ